MRCRRDRAKAWATPATPGTDVGVPRAVAPDAGARGSLAAPDDFLLRPTDCARGRIDSSFSVPSLGERRPPGWCCPSDCAWRCRRAATATPLRSNGQPGCGVPRPAGSSRTAPRRCVLRESTIRHPQVARLETYCRPVSTCFLFGARYRLLGPAVQHRVWCPRTFIDAVKCNAARGHAKQRCYVFDWCRHSWFLLVFLMLSSVGPNSPSPDQDGEVLDILVHPRWDRRGAERFLQKLLKTLVSKFNRVGDRVTPVALPHHRTCGSAYGGS